ncbi:hypothetical protein GCM10023188_28020 [Pontibacter saemangeumensis]|uniref:Transposase IS200-like domain-containing protein n=1 Tax=Pontibacter saemangeumensis TaxID=1084525 RepID=A0ABP8LUP8_9BACT
MEIPELVQKEVTYRVEISESLILEWVMSGRMAREMSGRSTSIRKRLSGNDWTGRDLSLRGFVGFNMIRPDRKLNRLGGHDYSKEGLYFITSCVFEKACVFGEVKNYEMLLNDYGKIAQRQWDWLAEQYPYLILHAFVVMPNHVHGIIEINQENITADSKVKSLSALIGVYKTTTSKQIRQHGLLSFTWQRSFHDHIIRHERAYRHIMQYIQNNPAIWQEDVYYQNHS